MQTFGLALFTFAFIGHVFCDTAHTANLISAESSDTNAVYTGSQSVDNNLYYNNYANDPYNNGYYDYSNDPTLFAPQAPVEADRQDVFGGGLTVAAVIPVVTIFAAALAGSILAPAVRSAARAMFDFAAEIPNIEINLPGTEEEENEVRSLKGSGLWSRMMTNVVSNLAEEFNTHYKGKFEKFLNTNNL